MLTADETRIFAVLLKRLGGKVEITRTELLSVEGWRIAFEQDYRTNTWRATLTRVGETFEGETSGLHPNPEEDNRRLSSRQRLLSVRQSFLAQKPLSEGDGEIPPDEGGFFGEEG